MVGRGDRGLGRIIMPGNGELSNRQGSRPDLYGLAAVLPDLQYEPRGSVGTEDGVPSEQLFPATDVSQDIGRDGFAVERLLAGDVRVAEPGPTANRGVPVDFQQDLVPPVRPEDHSIVCIADVIRDAHQG